LNEAPKNGLQNFSPQKLPCKKMALTVKFLNISPSMNLLRMPRISILYRFEVGNYLPTSIQDLASKRDLDPPIMAKISQNMLKIH
jgi:hypothetical protein